MITELEYTVFYKEKKKNTTLKQLKKWKEASVDFFHHPVQVFMNRGD